MVTFSIWTCPDAPFTASPVSGEGVLIEISGSPAATVNPRWRVRI